MSWSDLLLFYVWYWVHCKVICFILNFDLSVVFKRTPCPLINVYFRIKKIRIRSLLFFLKLAVPFFGICLWLGIRITGTLFATEISWSQVRYLWPKNHRYSITVYAYPSPQGRYRTWGTANFKKKKNLVDHILKFSFDRDQILNAPFGFYESLFPINKKKDSLIPNLNICYYF